MITAASLALLAANWDDERYEELPDWDKGCQLALLCRRSHFRIPPFEIGVLFGTIPGAWCAPWAGRTLARNSAKAIAGRSVKRSRSTPRRRSSSRWWNPYFNYDAFRGIPIENAWDLAVQAEGSLQRADQSDDA